MDFCVASKKDGFYNKEILSMGGKLYYYPPKSKDPFKSFFTLKNIIKKNNYRYVIRVSQHSLATIDLIAARYGGAQVLIQRSSNSDSGSNRSRILHRMFRFLPMTIPTVKIAPSIDSAKYTFGKNCINNGDVTLVKNAIAVDDFLFDPDRRKKIREAFNIHNKFVIGHVGRFNIQKNHGFLIDTFAEIVKKHADSVLMLVGKGELEKRIKEKIETLGLMDKVIFMGVRADIPDLLMGMDVFVFPSFYEGMPNTVIEAQATGLKCLVSDNITKEVGFTDLVEFCSLDLKPCEWAEAVLRCETGYERRNMKEEFFKQGYDIGTTVKLFEKLLNIEGPGQH